MSHVHPHNQRNPHAAQPQQHTTTHNHTQNTTTQKPHKEHRNRNRNRNRNRDGTVALCDWSNTSCCAARKQLGKQSIWETNKQGLFFTCFFTLSCFFNLKSSNRKGPLVLLPTIHSTAACSLPLDRHHTTQHKCSCLPWSQHRICLLQSWGHAHSLLTSMAPHADQLSHSIWSVKVLLLIDCWSLLAFPASFANSCSVLHAATQEHCHVCCHLTSTAICTCWCANYRCCHCCIVVVNGKGSCHASNSKEKRPLVLAHPTFQKRCVVPWADFLEKGTPPDKSEDKQLEDGFKFFALCHASSQLQASACPTHDPSTQPKQISACPCSIGW